ncbi:MAG: hypothetical protein ACJ749_02835 [Flavisolibacter sp.]
MHTFTGGRDMQSGTFNEIHHTRGVTVDANRKGLLWALLAFAILAAFGAVYWLTTRDIDEHILSPQTNEKIERPFNAGVLPAEESTPVGQ